MKKTMLCLSLCLTVSAAAHASPLLENDKYLRFGITKIEADDHPGQLFNSVETSISESYRPTLAMGIFLNEHISVDLLAGVPPQHNFYGDGVKLGSTKYLPPTLSLQYHFNKNGSFNPYLGVGYNYVYFYDTETVDGSDVDLSNSHGVALNAGFEYFVNKKFSLGFDYRYVKVDSDVKIDGAYAGNLKIDPSLYSLTLGYHF